MSEKTAETVTLIVRQSDGRTQVFVTTAGADGVVVQDTGNDIQIVIKNPGRDANGDAVASYIAEAEEGR